MRFFYLMLNTLAVLVAVFLCSSVNAQSFDVAVESLTIPSFPPAAFNTEPGGTVALDVEISVENFSQSYTTIKIYGSGNNSFSENSDYEISSHNILVNGPNDNKVVRITFQMPSIPDYNCNSPWNFLFAVADDGGFVQDNDTKFVSIDPAMADVRVKNTWVESNGSDVCGGVTEFRVGGRAVNDYGCDDALDVRLQFFLVDLAAQINYGSLTSTNGVSYFSLGTLSSGGPSKYYEHTLVVPSGLQPGNYHIAFIARTTDRRNELNPSNDLAYKPFNYNPNACFGDDEEDAVAFRAGSPTTDVSVFPNPTSDVVNVQLSALAGPAELQLLNVNGQVIERAMLKASGGMINHSFDVSSQPKGFYLVRLIKDAEVASVHKLLVN